MFVEIIETKIFAKQITELLSNEQYREFQLMLINEPTKGNIIKGSSGLRKIRWNRTNKSKRDGIRIIYYWFVEKSKILMLYAYSKSEVNDLTKNQIKILNKIIESEYNL